MKEDRNGRLAVAQMNGCCSLVVWHMEAVASKNKHKTPRQAHSLLVVSIGWWERREIRQHAQSFRQSFVPIWSNWIRCFGVELFRAKRRCFLFRVGGWENLRLFRAVPIFHLRVRFVLGLALWVDRRSDGRTVVSVYGRCGCVHRSCSGVRIFPFWVGSGREDFQWLIGGQKGWSFELCLEGRRLFWACDFQLCDVDRQLECGFEVLFGIVRGSTAGFTHDGYHQNRTT